MAKVRSSIATSLQGRIGNVSFRRASGQRIIASELPALVTNPRTVAQMSQRVRLAALVNFYRASRSWMPKTWQMKEAKQSVYNAFVRANLTSNPVALTKQEAAEGATVLYPWRVTDGTLNPVSVSEGSGSVFISNIFIGSDASVLGASATVSDLSVALLANNLSLRPGDQISFILYRQMSAASGMPYVTCTPYELRIDTADGRLVSSRLPQGIIQAAGDEAALSIGVNMDGIAGAFAIVVSRRDGSGNIEVSKSNLVCASSSLYSYYTNPSHQAAAAASYGENADVFIDPDGLEVRAYNDAAVTRQVLGFYYGPSVDNLTYVPAGAQGPDNYSAGTMFSVKVTNTEGIASSNALRIYRLVDGVQSVAYVVPRSECTITGSTITYTREAAGRGISLIHVLYEDNTYIEGSFQVQGGIEG